MTDEGLFWLAVHTACSFNQSYKIDEIPDWCTTDYVTYLETEKLEDISVDKMTLEDRVEWTNRNMDTIIEYGETHKLVECEKPISYLACCIEIYDYTVAKRKNQLFLTRLPIPVDGSNNGWQHLAAMSKDSQAGELVGLTPQEIQQDFYVQTGKRLHTHITDQGIARIISQMPMKCIRKGISKRGSMTKAYSAGAKAIAKNMWNDCRTAGYDRDYGLEEGHCLLLATALDNAIADVCTGPLQTMRYLQDIAAFELGKHEIFSSITGKKAGTEYRDAVGRRRNIFHKKFKTEDDLTELNDITLLLKSYEHRLVYGNGSKYLTWTTPSGFTVKYRKYRNYDLGVKASIRGYTKYHKTGRVNLKIKVQTDNPEVKGFMSGIAPNFVHSMDAAHMALVIDQWNGDFGAVHDSFSTHACDVEHLIGLTKRTFIDMYDVDNFYNYIEDQLITDKANLEIVQPELGDLNIEEIEDSDYFFA